MVLDSRPVGGSRFRAAHDGDELSGMEKPLAWHDRQRYIRDSPSAGFRGGASPRGRCTRLACRLQKCLTDASVRQTLRAAHQ